MDDADELVAITLPQLVRLAALPLIADGADWPAEYASERPEGPRRSPVFVAVSARDGVDRAVGAGEDLGEVLPADADPLALAVEGPPCGPVVVEIAVPHKVARGNGARRDCRGACQHAQRYREHREPLPDGADIALIYDGVTVHESRGGKPSGFALALCLFHDDLLNRLRFTRSVGKGRSSL